MILASLDSAELKLRQGCLVCKLFYKWKRCSKYIFQSKPLSKLNIIITNTEVHLNNSLGNLSNILIETNMIFKDLFYKNIDVAIVFATRLFSDSLKFMVLLMTAFSKHPGRNG